MRRRLAIISTRALVTIAMAGLLVGPAPAQERDQLERRVQSIGTLIEASSAARQIESSGVGAARERRDNARLIHREAATAMRAGDLASAARLLDQAAREIMLGVRLAKPEQVTGEKDRIDYENRLESARALLVAQQRITQEKSAGPQAQQATLAIGRQIDEAVAMAASNRMQEARTLIDRAYLTARVSIESLRGGDTLVRSLNFGSKREEFAYEIDRNDTHRMLISVLLADRKDAAGAMPPAMRGFTEKAAALRAQAEVLAQGGDHAGAIKLLEESTRELVRAIRTGGVYIPG